MDKSQKLKLESHFSPYAKIIPLEAQFRFSNHARGTIEDDVTNKLSDMDDRPIKRQINQQNLTDWNGEFYRG